LTRTAPSPSPDERASDGSQDDAGLRLGPWLIIALAAALRIPLLLVTTGVDYPFYLELGRLSSLGFLPYRDFWLEYPPVFPWIVVAAYRLTLLMPAPAFYPLLPDALAGIFHFNLGLVLVAADLVGIGLVWRICRQLWSRAEAERRTLVYAVLFWPIIVALGWYDTLPCTMLLLGLWLILRGQAGRAGAVAGLGFMTKIFPAILVPIAWKFLPGRRERLAALLGATVVTAAIAIPHLLLNATYFVASYRVVFERSAWETIWAMLDGYYSFGKVAPLGTRFDPATADYVAYPSRVPTLPLTIGCAVLFVILWLRPVPRTARNAVLFTGIAMLGFLVYSKGYSPQFIVYALPFTMILFPWRRALGYTAALSCFNLLGWPLFYEWFDSIRWVMGIAIVGRTALFLALIWEWVAELWGWPNPLLAFRPTRRLALAGGTVALVATLAFGVFTWQVWTGRMYEGSPLRPAFDFAARHDPAPGGRAAYIFADRQLYESFYPYFATRGDFYLLLPEGTGDEALEHPSLTPEGRQAQMAAIARDHQQIFLIRNADDRASRDLSGWLGDNARLVAANRADNVDLTYWDAKR
jgi:uncharacterized membrane protein